MSAPRLLRPAKEDGGHYGQVWMMIAASVRFLSGNPSFHICIELGFCIPMHVFLIIICIPTYLVGQLRPRGGGSLCGLCYGDGAVPEPWKPRETCPKAGSGPGSETAAGGGEGQAQGHGGWVSGCVAAKSEFQLTVTLLHRTPGRMFFFSKMYLTPYRYTTQMKEAMSKLEAQQPSETLSPERAAALAQLLQKRRTTGNPAAA